MSDLSAYHTLEADLERHQASGDFTAQVGTLLAMANIAFNNQEFSIAQGLYGRIGALYERINDKRGSIKLILTLLLTLRQNGDFKIYRHDRGEIFNSQTTPQLTQWTFTICEQEEDLSERGALYFFLYRCLLTSGRWATPLAWTAYQKAFATYEAAGDQRGQANLLITSPTFRHDLHEIIKLPQLHDPQTEHLFLEQALPTYQAVNDATGEARVRYILGGHALFLSEYDVGQAWLESSQALSLATNDGTGFVRSSSRLLHLAAGQGRAAYVIQQLKILGLIQTHVGLHATLNRWAKQTVLNLYSECAHMMIHNRDYRTARVLYQQAISFAAAIGRPQDQCELYYLWAVMEHSKAHRPEMGMALYRQAASLFAHYFPQRSNPYDGMKTLESASRWQIPITPSKPI